ncbi:hypothetical protein PRZ48_000445 [Zasmidium cellare]|uniref:Uncharacterized protein n=1 Tax=Zasmidium cellare TaxID=395010 RepID=A0ABR0EYI2_ZASCE|nr:hypothetical protein PRZ48_000445 [Zasmidium cellare]
MPSLRSIVLLSLPLLSLALPEPRVEESECDPSTIAEWEEMLKELPGDSIKAALEGNLKPKYRDGVFVDGHEAIDAVHNDDPELASRLVDLAKQDAVVKEYLKKRQDTNSTTSSPAVVTSTTAIVITDSSSTAVTFTTASSPTQQSTTPTSPTSTEATSVSVPTTDSQGQSTTTAIPVSSTEEASSPITAPTVSEVRSTQTGILVPIQITSTSDGTTVLQTISALETGSAPTSVMIAMTTTNSRGETFTTSTAAPAIAVTSTDDQGSVITTATPVSNVAVAPGGSVVESSRPALVTTSDSQGDQVILSSPTPGGVYTVTDVKGQIATVTYQVGSGGVVSQLRVATTTLPNGERSTITSFAEVGAQTGDITPPPSGSSSPTARPSLQSGAAELRSYFAAELAVVLGAAIGMAAMLL